MRYFNQNTVLFVRIGFVVILILGGLTACDPPGTWATITPNPTVEIEPTETPVPTLPPENTGEARIRYIMADIALMQSMEYYKGFPEDPEAVEAINRFYAGYGIQNLSDFERKDIPGIGWQIVYAGTNTTIYGMDVILTDPPSPLELCNPGNLLLTQEEVLNCGKHQYSQSLLSLAITSPPGGTCGFYVATDGAVDGGEPRGSNYPPSGEYEFTFTKDGLCFVSWGFSEGVEDAWFFEGQDCDNNKEALWQKTGDNTYSYRYESSMSGAFHYVQEWKLIFTSSGFSVEKYYYDNEFNGLCGSMSATFINEP